MEETKARTVNWKIAADRMVISERVELKTLSGFWVRVRRFTKQGEASIKAAELKPFIKRQAVRKQIIAEASVKGRSDDEAMTGYLPDGVEGRIMGAVLEGLDGDTVSQLEAKMLAVQHGVFDHNFENEDGGPATAEWVKDLTTHAPATFDEISDLVQEKNRPLAVRTSESSPTLPNGSTTGLSSQPT
jgi:hypothetical protein